MEARFAQVSKRAAKTARRRYLNEENVSSTDDESPVRGQQRKQLKSRAKATQAVIEKVSAAIEGQEDRMRRMERKVDTLTVMMQTLLANNRPNANGK